MDRRRSRLAGSPVVGAAVRPAEFASLHDWLTEHALESAVTAEDELAIDWHRHCDRQRHEHIRVLRARRDGTAGLSYRTGTDTW